MIESVTPTWIIAVLLGLLLLIIFGLQVALVFLCRRIWRSLKKIGGAP